MDILSYKLGKNSGGGSEPSEYNAAVDASKTEKLEWGYGIASMLTNLDKNAFATFNSTNCDSLFSGCSNLATIPSINTTNATNLSGMFANCSKLISIPSINTTNAQSSAQMFSGCTSLTSIPLLNTSKINDMSDMFRNCKSLTTIPLLDTSNVQNMSNMFYGSGLVELPNINTSKVTNVSMMFMDCSKLTTVPVLNLSKVTNMNYMFAYVKGLTDTSLDNILQMCIGATSFKGTKKLSTLQIYTSNYPASRIQALPHYQDFIDAGWTIS